MSAFFSVVNEFKDLITRFDFKQPKKLWYPHLVALSKPIEDIFYCHVIARVYKHDGSLQTTMWVGPIDRPDDGLNNLSAHMKVDIGYTQIPDENFFRQCEKKIIHLLEAGTLTALVASSRMELADPAVSNRRYEVYTAYLLPFFRKMLTLTEHDKKILGNKKQCEAMIEKELSNLDGAPKAFFEKLGVNSSKEKIGELCYLYSL